MVPISKDTFMNLQIEKHLTVYHHITVQVLKKEKGYFYVKD